jgi:hypothetical protein
VGYCSGGQSGIERRNFIFALKIAISPTGSCLMISTGIGVGGSIVVDPSSLFVILFTKKNGPPACKQWKAVKSNLHDWDSTTKAVPTGFINPEALDNNK